jgi:hypothetical protein
MAASENHLRKIVTLFIKVCLLKVLFFASSAFGQSKTQKQQPRTVMPGQTQTPLDPSIQLNQENVSSVFKDMVVVQRKAKEKGGKFLFNGFGSFDFSDGPVTMYGLNTNFGYAFSDFWEVYLNYVPMFITQERSIVGKVSSLTLDETQCVDTTRTCTAQITYARPKSQIGVEILWIPAYGKDSWGPYSIVRSDTFFKLGVGTINYDSGSGSRYSLNLGKTYFISDHFNFRIAAGMAYLQTIVDSVKRFNTVAILESGLVFYF